MGLYAKAVINETSRILNNPWVKFSHLSIIIWAALLFITSRIPFDEWYSQASIALIQIYELSGTVLAIVLIIFKHKFIGNSSSWFEAFFYLFAFSPFSIIKWIVTDPFRRIRRRRRWDNGWIYISWWIPVIFFLILIPVIDKQKDIFFFITTKS